MIISDDREKYILELESRLSQMEQKIIELESSKVQSEEKFNKVFNENQVSMSITRIKDGVLIDANENYAKNMGYRREDMIGKSNYTQLNICGLSHEGRQEKLNKLKAVGFLEDLELQFRKKNGEIGYALSTHTLININGELCRLSSAIDITERKKAEQKLRASEEKFSKSFHESGAMKAITRCKDGVIIDVNESHASAFGFNRVEMIGKTTTEFGAWSHSLERQPMLEQLFKEGSVRDWEYKFRTKSGDVGTVVSNVDLIEVGGEQCVLVSSINITERIKAEEALIQSQRLWNQIFNSVPLPMTVRRIKDKRILEVNNAYLTRYRLDRSDFLKIRDSEIDILPLNSYMNDCIQIIKEKGILKNYEATYQLPTGKIITVLMSGVLIFWEGEECVLTISNDITEQKAYIDEIKRLDSLNLMGQMAGSIAHEVRNPMTSIKGFLQLFQHQPEYKEDKTNIELMVEELDRINEIISAFLSLAQKNAIKLTLRNLNQKVTNFMPLIMADAIKNDVSVVTELSNIPPVMLDKGEIRQLLLNLTHNGIEAMLKGGTLRIKTFEDKNGVNLVIQDEGKGIPPDILDKIGTPFLTTKKEGTGLGLAVCYSIAERHDAMISFNTSEQGTSFKVTFPVVA